MRRIMALRQQGTRAGGLNRAGKREVHVGTYLSVVSQNVLSSYRSHGAQQVPLDPQRNDHEITETEHIDRPPDAMWNHVAIVSRRSKEGKQK